MAGARVGVLAVQGDVREHASMLEELGSSVVRVRSAASLESVDGLVIPGGESSVIDRLAGILGFRDRLVERIASGMPVLGTCAGLIVLARRILDAAPGQRSFGGLDIDVRRNAFGSQVDSFEAELRVPAIGEPAVRATFIRAPVVERVGEGVEVLALVGERVVAVESGAITGLAFHPELTGEPRFHERFLARVASVH